MSIVLPWRKKPSANGKASAEGATVEQRDRIEDYSRVLKQNAHLWRVCKLLGGALTASTLTIGVMSVEARPRAVGWVQNANGVQRFVGEAQPVLSPTEATIDSSLVTYLRNLREIPGSDYRLVDEHLRVAHRVMTVPNSPAEKDELAFWDAHNPKAEARSITRIIVDKNPTPTCNRLGSSLTFSCVFGEQTRDNQGSLTTVARTGMIQMQSEPVLPTDSGAANDNSGGIDVWSISHSLVEE
jgi:type IV secretory pathway TrbF-like protein